MIVSKHADDALGSIADIRAFLKSLPGRPQPDGRGPGLQGR